VIRQWIAAHRSVVVTATSATVVAALVAAAAIVSTGYTAQRIDLQDPAVWVSNGQELAAGRINTEVLELNSVLAGAGSDLDVLQDGDTVLLADRANSTLAIVDPATSRITETIALPPDEPEVFLADDTVTIVARGTGQIWTVAVAGLASFDAESEPALRLGAALVASMDNSGALFVYSPESALVYEVSPGGAAEVRATSELEVPDDALLSITSVDDQWAVLDERGRTLYFDGRTVDLPDAVGPLELQRASSTGSAVILADSDGLTSVPVADGATTTLLTGRSGAPARPVVLDDCIVGAWGGDGAGGGAAWRQCGTSNEQLMALDSVRSTAVLELRTNQNRVVLNDSLSGDSWAVQAGGELINNWDALIPPDNTEQQVVADDDTPPDIDPVQQPPVAIDDELGARPGRATVLPVLLNDYDPNGDALVISEIPTLDEGVGRLDLINNDQQVQLTLTGEASGTISIAYSISDGRGGTSSATATVTVRGADENSPPQQARSTKATVEAGGRVSAQVLGDWVDPDGDAFYLAGVTVREPDLVTFTPQGMVLFEDSGAGETATSVTLTVSDGTASAVGTLDISVLPAGTVPIVADPFVVLATSGQQITVAPLDHVRGGNGVLRLGSVPPKAGVDIVPSYESGEFRLTSTTVGSHYLDYVVTDGEQTATGVVRVDVAPPVVGARPITIPKTVFVQSLRTEQVDVAGSDLDPAGGVLVVTGVQNLAADSGVSAEVLEQRFVRVRLDDPLDGPVAFNYRVSNGLADAEGVITVIEIPVPSVLQPPIAVDDQVTVRAGAAIDIPVLDNDSQPDGADLALLPQLPQDLPEGAGLLFSSGKVLRYLAPATPGNFLAVYEIEGPDGQRARAQLSISVREANLETNSAPVPATLTARSLAGGTVVIPVPLSGIDPDGDTVQLLGQETNPEKGSVIAVASDTITYRAGDYSSGTDEFQYSVIDALGARATGTVRVGISAALDGARNPVATLDEVTVRPGTTVSVRVLENDSDPDGSPLTVTAVTPNDDVTLAEVSGDLVVITPPATPGVYGVVYAIENESGGTSSNFVRVAVDPNAPLSYPVVTDTQLTLADILDRTRVDVDVLDNVFFADGDPSTLIVTVGSGFDAAASVTPTGVVRVTPADTSQIIPFRVTHPDDDTVFSYGFIWVPGYNDALPQLNRDAPTLSVVSGEPLRINLNDYVLSVGDGGVGLTDTSSVRATHNNGAELVVDRQTLVFTSADQYFGAASISFEVTDGESATDPNGRTATLVLPITVLPRDNQPPVFSGAVLEVEPAEERTIDLSRLTTYPYPDDLGELAYTVLSVPEGFTYGLDGQKLSLRANESVATGTVATMSIGVRDDVADGTAGTISLTVVPSTRPLARPATDTGTARRGETTVIDVLANDNATNPFPGTPLVVSAIRGIDSAALPAGVRVTPSADRSTLTVAVAPTASPVDTTLQYQVTDATGEASRAVWGTVRISVQDRPDPVRSVRVTEIADRRLTVVWNSAGFNNSPITGYQVQLVDVATGAEVSSTACGGAQCQVETRGNGSQNAVRVNVVATNAIGASDAASINDPTWSDVVPATPAKLVATPLDHGLRVSWAKPADAGGGSAITKYVVTVAGAPTQEIVVGSADAVGTVYSRSFTGAGITNGSAVTFTVSARNQTPSALARWNTGTGTGTPAGAPLRINDKSPSAELSADDSTRATLTWPGSYTDNGRAITDYYAAVIPASSSAVPSCTVSGDLPGAASVPGPSSTFQHLGTATSATFTGLTANTTYRFVVYASNGMGCTASAPVEATPRARPGTVTAASFSDPANRGTTWDYQLSNFTIGSGSTDADTFIYRLSGTGVEGGQHGPQAPGTFVTTSNGSHYGQSVSIELKACKKYGEFSEPLCSADWSQPQTIGVPVSSPDLGGLSLTHGESGGLLGPPATGSYTWSSSPNGSYDSVTYSCGDNEGTLEGGEGGSCEVTENGTLLDGVLGLSFPDLTVTITVNNKDYVRVYDWNDYD
jgi:hypothetical protein